MFKFFKKKKKSCLNCSSCVECIGTTVLNNDKTLTKLRPDTMYCERGRFYLKEYAPCPLYQKSLSRPQQTIFYPPPLNKQ